jgi:DNA-binding beta-propeller fold protein YncE
MKYLQKRIKTVCFIRSLMITLCCGAFLVSTPSGGLCASPVTYLVLKHVRDIKGDFNQPTEVAVSSGKRTYVLDGANNKVKIFDAHGKLLLSFGGLGEKFGKFDHPVGMDLDEQENIYIADTGNKRIQIFDSQGNFLRAIDLAPLHGRPVEVKYSSQTGRLYVSDTENQKIHCFNIEGDLAFSWGGYGKGIGEFMYPGMIDIDAAGNLHVVDILNGRLQIFDSSGGVPRQLSKFGIKPGTLFRPKGVLVDDQSLIYVSDSYTGVIQVFNMKGSLVGILSEDGKSPLHLSTPLGMALDSVKNQLYVVQAELNMISVFEFRDNT